MTPIARLTALLVLLFPISLMAENEGLEDLDRATDLQLQAKSLADLEEVADVAEGALKKGLDEENTKFAKQLLVSALYQHAQQLSGTIFSQGRPHPQWQQIRDLAKKDTERILKHDDKFADAYVMQGRLSALPGGDRDKAREAFTKAIELFKEAGEKEKVSETLVFRLTMGGSAEERLADLNAAIEANPMNVQAWQMRAAHYIGAQQFDKAIEDFKTVIEQAPENLTVRQALAGTYASQKQFDEAIATIDEAIELAPDNPQNYAVRAEINEQREKLDEAISDLGKAIEAEPNFLIALMTRARLHYLNEDFDAARGDIDRLLQARPGLKQAILMRSAIAAAQEKYGQAIADIESLLNEDPANIELRMQLASLCIAAERPRRAIQILTTVLEDTDDNWMAMRARADALLSVGRHADAVTDYNTALQLKPDDDGILNNLAWVLSTSPMDDVRDGKRSIELATKACEVTNYGKPHILSTLAAAYAETGDFENAIKWSSKAVEDGRETLKDQIEQLQDELEHYKRKEPFRELQNIEEKADEPDEVVEA